MTAADLVRELEARSIRVRVVGGRARAEGLMTPRLRAELAVLERDVIAFLAPGIACPHYEPLHGTKRCRSYHPNGACGRPDEFMCVEWLRANGHQPRTR